MKEGATKLPPNPKEEPVDIVAESAFGVDQKSGHKGAPSSPILLLTGRGNPAEGSAPVPPAAPAVFVLGWGSLRSLSFS